MRRDLDALIVVAELLRDRDLGILAGAARAATAARRVEAGLAADVAARRAALREEPGLEAARPGAFEAWLRHVRRVEARLAAVREAAAREEAASRARARRSFGRAVAVGTLGAGAPGRGKRT